MLRSGPYWQTPPEQPIEQSQLERHDSPVPHLMKRQLPTGRIAAAIAQCGGNKSEAAWQLGLTYRGLLKKMPRFGMVSSGGRQG